MQNYSNKKEHQLKHLEWSLDHCISNIIMEHSRYYNPKIGRFINADGIIGQPGDVFGHNMYAYCKNNPVMMVNPNGTKPFIIIPNPMLSIDDFKKLLYGLGSAILNHKGYDTSQELYEHAFYGAGETVTSSDKLVDDLKNSNEFNEELKKIKNENSGSDSFNQPGNIQFTKGDLYYSLQHLEHTVSGQRINGYWKFTFTIYDTYDFTEWRWPTSLGSIANDGGIIMQKIGFMKPYDICVSYEYEWRS